MPPPHLPRRVDIFKRRFVHVHDSFNGRISGRVISKGRFKNTAYVGKDLFFFNQQMPGFQKSPMSVSKRIVTSCHPHSTPPLFTPAYMWEAMCF